VEYEFVALRYGEAYSSVYLIQDHVVLSMRQSGGFDTTSAISEIVVAVLVFFGSALVMYVRKTECPLGRKLGMGEKEYSSMIYAINGVLSAWKGDCCLHQVSNSMCF
jgi:hypothetical protein